MKVSTKGQSRFLGQEDIPETGFTLIIDDVKIESLKSNRGEENKYILYFTQGKPMVFNVVNRQTVVGAYGDDSVAWRGKPLEIFVDPNVYLGGERTGGIRVRIPRQSVKPAPANPTAQPRPTTRVHTIEEKQAAVLRGYANATTEAMVMEVAAWADNQDFAPHHHEERIRTAKTPCGGC